MIRGLIILLGFQGAGEIVFRLISLPIPGSVIGLVLLLAFMTCRGKVVALCVPAWWQRGIAIGVVAHGIGTSRALSVNAEAGAFAGAAMDMHGVADAVLIPLTADLAV